MPHEYRRGLLIQTIHQPDLLILDIMLADGSVIDSIEMMKQLSPKTRILVLSGNAELHTNKKGLQ